MVSSEGDYEVNVGESVFNYLAAWFDEYCRGCGFEDRGEMVFYMWGAHIEDMFFCFLFVVVHDFVV